MKTKLLNLLIMLSILTLSVVGGGQQALAYVNGGGTSCAGACVNCPDNQANSCDTGLPVIGGDNATSQNDLQTIFQIIFGIIGGGAVIIILLAGFRFVVSQGDPQSVKRARETIIYAAIGLVIAVLAEVIVTFVLGKL